MSVLQLLVSDCRAAHREIHNAGKLSCNLKVGDAVKAHVQVNSVASKGVVSKLRCCATGPFTSTADLGHNSFEVQRYDNPSSAKRKYKNTEL